MESEFKKLKPRFHCCFRSLLSCFGKPTEVSASELRLLCSYGGQVTAVDSSTPRYSGGENRVVTVDRRCSASKLLHHISATLFGGSVTPQSFTLKYHLSVSGARSLVSVVTDEDLRHMIEAHDRISSKQQYLRVFIFPKSPSRSGFINSTSPPNDRKINLSSDGDLKLRFMCRYGGRFYYYPCRNSQSYIGGENRVVVMDRPSSILSLSEHLSRVLFDGFAISLVLKYQSPREGLDCLVSLTTDEDLKSMIELYEGLSSFPPKNFHFRLYVFTDESLIPSLPINSDPSVEKISDSNPRADNVISAEEPVGYKTQIEVVPDPNCKFQMQLVQNKSGDLIPTKLNPIQHQQMQESLRAGAAIQIDHASGLPLKQ